MYKSDDERSSAEEFGNRGCNDDWASIANDASALNLINHPHEDITEDWCISTGWIHWVSVSIQEVCDKFQTKWNTATDVVVAPNLCLKLIGWHWLDLFCSSWGESSLDGLNTSADCTFFLWSHPIALVSCVVDTKVEWAIVLLGPWYCCCLTIDAGLISWSIDWCCWFIGDPIESITAGISFDIWMDGSACCCISDAAETVIVSGCLSRWKNDMIWSIRFIVCLRWSCWRWINCCISWFNLLFASRLCS